MIGDTIMIQDLAVVCPPIVQRLVDGMNDKKNDLNTRTNFRNTLKTINDHLYSNIKKFDTENGLRVHKRVR